MSKRPYRFAFSLFLIIGVVAAWAVSVGAQQAPRYVPQEVIIKLKPSTSAVEIAAVRASLDATVKQRYRSIGAELWEIKGSSVTAAMDRLKNDSRLEYIEPNYVVRALDVFPNDPRFDDLWGMHNTGQTGGTPDADIDAPEAWSLGTGADVLCGVIDTGVDYNHVDLSTNIFSNPNEIADNLIDDDGNGYIDDTRGWDFVNDDNNPMDDHGHGTHCSGTIAGIGNNGIGVVGVSWTARILPLKFLDAGGSGNTGDAILAIEYATGIGARLTSNSWGGGGFSLALQQAIEAADAAGILFVAAAGNNSSNNDVFDNWPSNYPVQNVIAVASTTHNDGLSGFSNFGLTMVDLGAPGSDILSTFPGNQYGVLSGTSMATPHVAGAVCLVWGAAPTMTHMEVKNAIMATVDVIPELVGRTVTGGRLNVHTLMSSLDDVRPDAVSDLAVSSTGSSHALLAWTASGDDGAIGTASSYDVRYSTSPIDSSNFDSATPASGEPAPQASGSPESFEVSGLDVSTTYYFALVAEDERGNRSGVSNDPDGTTLAAPTLDYDPTLFSASLLTGGSDTQTLTISNTGVGTLDFNFGASALQTGALGGVAPAILPSWLSASPASGRVNAGQSVEVALTFDATGLFAGDYDEIVTFSTNDPAQESAPLDVSFHVDNAADVSAAPTSLDFGAHYLGLCVTLDVVVTNIGTLPLDVTNVSIDNPEFSTDPGGFTLGLGASRTLTVTFCPLTEGSLTGAMSIASNDPDHPTLTISLAGQGVTPPVIAVNPTSLSSDLFTGGSETQALTVSNNGGSDLTFDIAIEDLGSSQARLGTPQSARDRARDVTPAGVTSKRGGATYAAGHKGSGRPATASKTPAIRSASSMAILLVVSADVSEIQGLLLGYPDVATVDVFDAGSATPDLGTLSGYDAVILISNSAFSDGDALGDVLADYVDAGGGLVMTLATFIDGFNVSGRLLDDGYFPFTLGSGPLGGGNLAAFNGAHPIMAGVSSAFGDLLGATTLTPGAEWVADWDIGQPFIATQGDHVVGANVFVADGGFFSGDVALILHNAALWSAGATWLTAEPGEGVIPAGASLDVAVTFDATGLNGGDYLSNIRIANNDPFTPEVVVPASLHVTGAPDIDVSPAALAYGPVFIGGVSNKVVLISNEGTDELHVASIATDHPDFDVDVSNVDLSPGESQNVVVSYAPTTTGLATGTLTITSDDPDEASIAVSFDGEGLLPPIIGVAPTSFEDSLFTGETSTHTMTISNSGANNLEFEISTEEIDNLVTGVRQRISIPRSNGDFPRGTYASSARLAPASGHGAKNAGEPQPQAAVGSAFAAEAANLQAVQFRLNNPETLNFVGGTPTNIWAGDFGGDDSFVYAVDDFNQFMQIDTTTAAQTVLGTITPIGSEVWTGMAFDPTDRVMYATSTDVFSSSLYSIDVVTAIATRIGSIGFPGVIACAASSDGVLYAHDIVTDELLSIDKSTGAGTAIGSLGFDANFGQGMGFDGDSGQLYLAAFNNFTFQAELRIADVTTGATTFVGVLGGDVPGGTNQVSFLALPGLGGVRWLAADPTEGVVPPGTSMDIDVTFDATGLFGGDYFADLVIANNDPLNSEVRVPAHLHVTGAPDILVSDASHDFGAVFIGGMSQKTVNIKNVGTDVLTVSSISTDHGDYAVDVPSVVLAPATSQNVVMTYSPSSVGVSHANLTITSDDPDEAVIVVTLAGEGVEPPIIGVTPTSFHEDLFTGETASHTLTISNTGASPLDFTIALEDITTAVAASRAVLLRGRPWLDRSKLHGGGAVGTRTDVSNSRAPHTQAAVTPKMRSTAAEDPAILVIQDFESWGLDMATFIYDNFGITSTVIGSGQIPSTSFDDFDLVITCGAQSFNYYNALSSNVDQFEDYVQGGGVVQYQCATQGDDVDLAGGAHISFGPAETFNGVVDPSHPIVAGLPLILEGNAANHTIVTNLPSGTNVITETADSGDPTTVEYEIGSGSVVATGMTWEFLAEFGYEAGAMLGNAVAYSLSIAGVKWLAVEPREGVVAAGASMDLTVTYDAEGLYGGDYAANILVANNDPLTPEVIVPATLHVTGAPDIAIEDSLLAYGQVFLGVAPQKTVNVMNAGTDVLTVSSISTDHGDYTVNVPSLVLAPATSQDVIVTYSPTSVGVSNGNLTIASDDPDEGVLVISLTGEGVEPPVIAVTPTSISENVFAGATVTKQLTIDNSAGGSSLFWTASTRIAGDVSRLVETSPVFGTGEIVNMKKDAKKPALSARPAASTLYSVPPREARPTSSVASGTSLEDVLESLNANFGSVTSLISNRYDFSEGESGNSIGDGGNDMYDGGNFLGTDRGSGIFYSDNAIVSDAAFGTGGRYFTRKYPGMFVMAADMTDVEFFETFGNLGADGSGNVDGVELSTEVSGISFRGFVKRVYNAFDPSVNHLILVEENPAATHEFAISTDDDYHRVFNLSGTHRIYYVLYASANGGYVDNPTTLAIMDAFLNALGLAPDWLLVSPTSGTVPAGGSAVVDVTLDATELAGGDNDGEVLVASNDPVNPQVVVPAHMHVIGIPDIDVSSPWLAFGQVFVGGTATLNLVVSNAGTDVLDVTSVVPGAAEYSTDVSAFSLAPDAIQNVAVSLTPSALGLVIAPLTIASNDPDEPSVVVYLVGEGIEPPVISVTPELIYESVMTATSSTRVLNIANTGANTLSFNVSIEPSDALVAAAEVGAEALLENAAGSGKNTRLVQAGGGPDYYGYRWKDSNEAGGPDFAWIDASPGTNVLVSEDGFVSGLPLGFTFDFYRYEYTTVGVGANGWLSFNGSGNGHPNTVPQPDVYAGAIAPCARDLSPAGANYIRYITVGSPPNRRFVVEYNGVPDQGGGDPKTFEVIFCEGTNAIHFQYLVAGINDADGLGIERPDEGGGMGDGGIGDMYIDPALVADNYAIEFIGRPIWLEATPVGGAVAAGGNMDITVTLHGGDLEDGDYHASLVIASDDPLNPVVTVPVVMTVFGDPTTVLISDVAARPMEGGIELTWSVFSDEEILGFNVYRGSASGGPEDLLTVTGLVIAEERRYFDQKVSGGRSYSYRIAAVRADGSEVLSQAATAQAKQFALALDQNTPNPFNPTTRISYTLPRPDRVVLSVFDVAGRRITTLVDEVKGEGRHEMIWEGTDGNGTRVSSGVYFYQLTWGKQAMTKKMLLLK